VLFSALVAILLAVYANRTQRQIARRRATLDILFDLETDREYLECSDVFKDVRDSYGLEVLLNDGSHLAAKSQTQVDKYLNLNELIALGVFQNILDEEMVHKWMRGPLISDWKAAEKYIKAAREEFDNPKIYRPFQVLAEAWEAGRFPVTHGIKPTRILDDLDASNRKNDERNGGSE